jgi:hypothetical protein
MMSKYRILNLKPAVRLEWRGQNGQNEADQRYHCAAISFALWDGVNRALLESDSNTDRREIASGYRGDCAFTTVSRLSLLLDPNPKLVSFQTMYTRLRSDATLRGGYDPAGSGLV